MVLADGFWAGFHKGVFTAEGKDWGRARRLTAPAFSHANLVALVGTISVSSETPTLGSIFPVFHISPLFGSIKASGSQWLNKLKGMAAADGTITSGG